MRKINEIIVHCSATPEGKNYTVQDITKWHIARGFSTIGYHFVIYLDGSIHIGRPIDQVGAHCQGHNATSIGVCYIGGLDKDGKTAKDTRTAAQKNSLVLLLKQLRKKYGDLSIKGHRDYSPDTNHDGKIEKYEWLKACPSFDAAVEYKNI